MNYTLKNLQNVLHNNDSAKVTFTKVNGDEREMTCTLRAIPVERQPKGGSTKPKNPSVQVVFDLEADGWRSIREGSITSLIALTD